MKLLVYFPAILLGILPAVAQVEFTAENYFPADLEFAELENMTSETEFSDPAKLPGIPEGQMISDVGFRHYARREYSVGANGFLSIEIITLIDYRAAYSLLTLLRNSLIQEGPPGDAYASTSGTLLFSHGKRWIRIHSRQVSEDLVRRVSESISNRMGEPPKRFPSLVAYLPEDGLEANSLRYFPGLKSYALYQEKSDVGIVRALYEMEALRAQYSLPLHSADEQTGILSLLKFPTTQIAEEYFNTLSTTESLTGGHNAYFRMSGPVLCVLEGTCTSSEAHEILNAIEYSYSVQWIQDNSAIAWVIPVPILQTTVWSFFFVLILCVGSIVGGAGIAGIRLFMRRFLPNNPLDDPKRTEITRLKLQ